MNKFFCFLMVPFCVSYASSFEVGGFGGAFFTSSKHNFIDESKYSEQDQQALKKGSFSLGLRGGYIYQNYFGVEAEGQYGFVEDETNNSGNFLAGKTHLLLQYPTFLGTPFLITFTRS